MNNMSDNVRSFRLAHVIALVAMVAPVHSALAQRSGVIEPDAVQMLRASTGFLASRQRFSVDTESTLEAVLTSGQKIQFDHAATLAVQRPDKLRAHRRGDLVEQVLYYNGTSLTLHNPGDGVFATVAAPDSVEKMLDFARNSLDLVAPASDLIYRNAFDILMEDVNEGFVVGKSAVGGVPCTHLAFRSAHADWQIWIQEGSQPLPRKLVITSTDVLNAPQFSVLMSRWDLAPDFGDGIFEFIPPEDALPIDFLFLGHTGRQR